MTRDEAVWVARKYLETFQPGRIGMLLSDDAVHAVCKVLVELADKYDEHIDTLWPSEREAIAAAWADYDAREK